MPESDISVSIVILCPIPTRFLPEVLDNVWGQTRKPAEVLLVHAPSESPEFPAARVTRCIAQPDRGPGAARNAGFRASQGSCVLPLDLGDRLAPGFLAGCAAALEARPEAAFVYTDSERERAADFNFYRLLDEPRAFSPYLVRRAAWELAGGYDESLAEHCDWDFWLRLGERERFGYRLPGVLVRRRQERDPVDSGGGVRSRHPGLYSREGRGRIKARWAPAVCLLGGGPPPLLVDCQRLAAADPRAALEASNAPAFVMDAADPHDAEWGALAVWGGREATGLADGARCVSRRALSAGEVRPRAVPPASPPQWLPRHLVDAGLTSPAAFLRHPQRLIPLRVKEAVNRAAGRPVFDLSFYLKFQMASAPVGELPAPLLRYLPPPARRRRVGLITPHLGPGGAESVLLEIAGSIDRQRCEVFLLATQSADSRWRARWEKAADHVYDLAELARPERIVGAICSIAVNWEFDRVLLQNSLAGYSAIPHMRRERPSMEITDLIHAVDEAWDFVSASAPVAGGIDRRLVISEACRRRLLQAGAPAGKIRLIRNGVDLDGFRPAAPRPAGERPGILFAGRLEAVKRPLLLVEIALELARLRGGADFRMLVAGDGPESAALAERVRKAGLEGAFELLGHVPAMAEWLAAADVVVLPSRGEGIPLIVLEAFAAGRPVVCSRVGAIGEVVDRASGILVEPGEGEARRFAAALQSLLADPGLRQTMGQAGRRKVEAEYDLRQARQAYAGLFEDGG